MFKTLTSISMIPAVKKTSNHFFSRSLTTSNYTKPHTANYLIQQLADLAKRKVNAEVITLKKGTTLTGLDMYFEPELLRDAYPLFTKETLENLSSPEKDFFQKRGQEFFSRFAKFTLKEDVKCIKTTAPETNLPCFYIHRNVTKLGPVAKIEKLLPIDNSPSFKPSF